MALKFGQKLKQIIGAAAPKIGMAIGGPLGGIAGKFVQNALGVDNDEAAVAQLESDPDALLKLKQAEQDFAEHMRKLDIDEEALKVQDRASARDLAKATTPWPQIAISAVFILGYLTILGLFFADQLRVPMGEAFMVMLGVLTAGVTNILNFWFGSSHGSQGKDDTLAKALQSKS